MGRQTGRLIWGMVLSGILSGIGGCAASLPYQRAADEGYPGYFERHLDSPGSFQIDYMVEDKSLAYAKYAVYYRAAELTYETGYRYFIVQKAYNLTKKGEAWGDPKNIVGGMPGVRIFIQCYKEKPGQPAYDANQYLNQAKIPGGLVPYSVAQRHGDKATGSIPK